MDAKEFKKLCSVKIMLERLEKESWFDDTETDEIEEKRAVLGLEDEDSERSSTFCGESIFPGSSQSTSITVYSSDVSFIDDREELCEEFVYANPYCSQNSTPNERKINWRMKRKANVMRIDSDDSNEGFEEKVNIRMKKKKRVARIESDESSQSGTEMKKQVAMIESDEGSQSSIEIEI